MGCDIHAHFEVKINDKWEHYSIPNIKRNYYLFTKMAGVRNYDDEIKPISSPKGIPKDISVITKICIKLWEGAGHSYSWLNSQEIKEVIKFLEDLYDDKSWKVHHEEFGYFFGNGFNDFIDSKEEFLKEIEDLRLVFWFDN